MVIKFAALFFVTCLFMFSGTATARFVHIDALIIDSEENRDTKSFLDLATYITPLYWERAWKLAKNGYKMTTGSVDGFQSIYDEKIKFEQGNDSFRIAFKQSRYEDKVVWDEENELDFIFSPTRNFEYWFMASALGSKKWSDLGLALRFLDKENFNFLLKFWVVDGFYHSKEVILTDTYEDYIYTFEVDLEAKMSKNLSFALHITYDSPLNWLRESQQYNYQYSKSFSDLEVRQSVGDYWDLVFFGYAENKMESKIWSNIPGHQYSKKNDKDFYKAGLKVEYLKERYSLRLGAQYLKITQRNENFGYTNEDGHIYKEPPGESGNRTEYTAFIECSFPVWDLTNIQTGYYHSKLESSFYDPERSTQNKMQVMFDFRPSDETAVVLNLTYDVDKIMTRIENDFPDYNIYGGGNIQAMVYF